eukprot:m.269084 g.269084  ORF g.269084 m.269084 type:complete len:741 (-) comp15665_c2_seq6:23-2245(-)
MDSAIVLATAVGGVAAMVTVAIGAACCRAKKARQRVPQEPNTPQFTNGTSETLAADGVGSSPDWLAQGMDDESLEMFQFVPGKSTSTPAGEVFGDRAIGQSAHANYGRIVSTHSSSSASSRSVSPDDDYSLEEAETQRNDFDAPDAMDDYFAAMATDEAATTSQELTLAGSIRQPVLLLAGMTRRESDVDVTLDDEMYQEGDVSDDDDGLAFGFGSSALASPPDQAINEKETIPTSAEQDQEETREEEEEVPIIAFGNVMDGRASPVFKRKASTSRVGDGVTAVGDEEMSTLPLTPATTSEEVDFTKGTGNSVSDAVRDTGADGESKGMDGDEGSPEVATFRSRRGSISFRAHATQVTAKAKAKPHTKISARQFRKWTDWVDAMEGVESDEEPDKTLENGGLKGILKKGRRMRRRDSVVRIEQFRREVARERQASMRQRRPRQISATSASSMTSFSSLDEVAEEEEQVGMIEGEGSDGSEDGDGEMSSRNGQRRRKRRVSYRAKNGSLLSRLEETVASVEQVGAASSLEAKLSRRLSYKDLMDRQILLNFQDEAQVHEIQGISAQDRKADPTWTRLSSKEKRGIQLELDSFKTGEMQVHTESVQNIRLHSMPAEQRKFLRREGSQVKVEGYEPVGILRFFGPHQLKKGYRCGVEFSEPIGKNNGTVSDITYFKCPENCGILVRKTHTQMDTTSREHNVCLCMHLNCRPASLSLFSLSLFLFVSALQSALCICMRPMWYVK